MEFHSSIYEFKKLIMGEIKKVNKLPLEIYTNYKPQNENLRKPPSSTTNVLHSETWIFPGRALIHVFNNPYVMEGYLSWGYLSKKLEFFTPYHYK